MDFTIIPDYLSVNNPFLNTVLDSLGLSMAYLPGLRDVAILMHRLQLIDLVRSLWVTYRKSGTGHLPAPFPIDPSDTKIWPQEIRTLIDSSWMYVDDEANDDPYLSFVEQALADLLAKSLKFEQQLQAKKRAFPNYSDKIEKKLDSIVRERLQFIRVDIEHQMALVEIDFNHTILKRALQALPANEYQVGPFLSRLSSF